MTEFCADAPTPNNLLTKVSMVAGYRIVETFDDDPARKEIFDRVDAVIEEYAAHLQERTTHHLGYPYNLDFDFTALSKLQKFSVNNLGDPFVESNYGVHSRQFEVGVLEWFATIWEIEVEDMWGYVTNCGTEGNLHGILTGREVLPEAILYCSKATHYSVPKAGRMYRMPLCLVDALEGGEMDMTHLRACLMGGKAQNKPAIININMGTTVKGAVDDLDGVIELLEELGYSRDQYYIHVDGALFGLMTNFVGDDIDREMRERGCPKLTFKKNIDSISVSGHKFIGAPVPCGVVVTRKAHINKLSSDIEYLNSKDATIMGSRNGHASLYLWYAIQKKGMSGLRKDTIECFQKARKLTQMLKESGISTYLGPLSCTVVFERPLEHDFVRKWQLACEGDIAHVVVMPSTSVQTLEKFVGELIISRNKTGENKNARLPSPSL